MSVYIIGTSGFILPANNHFKPFTLEDELLDRIFSKSIIKHIDNNLVNFYNNEEVYRSDLVVTLLEELSNKNDFDSYIKLVDVSIDIFKDIDFIEFFKLQATNKFLSDISFNFCMDVVTGKYFTNYRDYYILPFNTRYNFKSTLTENDVLVRLDRIKREAVVFSWVNFLASLSRDKSMFITFYRFLLADYY